MNDENILSRAIKSIAFSAVTQGEDPKTIADEIADEIAEEVIAVLSEPSLRAAILAAMNP